MAIYPKQLQKFDEVSYASGPGGSRIRESSFENYVVLGDGSTAVANYTVNTILRFIEEAYRGYITTIDYTKSEPRFRPFDSDFGDEVVIPAGPIVGDKAAGELIDMMRVLWDIRHTRGANRTGHATSVQNN